MFLLRVGVGGEESGEDVQCRCCVVLNKFRCSSKRSGQNRSNCKLLEFRLITGVVAPKILSNQFQRLQT